LQKKKIIHFLKRKGVSEQKIIEAYQEYYKQERLYEITFNERPLGFSVIMDTRGKNAIVSSIQDENNLKLGMKVASRMYEVNGKRVDDLKHKDILKTISSQSTPFYVVFREARRNLKALEKIEKDKQNAYKWQDEQEEENNNNNNNSDSVNDYKQQSSDSDTNIASTNSNSSDSISDTTISSSSDSSSSDSSSSSSSISSDSSYSSDNYKKRKYRKGKGRGRDSKYSKKGNQNIFSTPTTTWTT